MSIIEPSIFYLISIVNAIKTFSVIVCTLSGVCLFAYASLRLLGTLDEEERQNDKEFIKYCIYVFIFSLLLNIILPSSTTAYRMLIAKHLTYDVLSAAKGELQTAVDYILSAASQIKGG